AVRPNLANDAALRLECVGAHPELPRGRAELGRELDDGLGDLALTAVEVPPVGSVGDEIEDDGRRPGRLKDRFLFAARYFAGLGEAAVIGERAHPQLVPVPRHVRVIPSEPREVRSGW